MARKAPLKVYRTAIGFHDAYVAAASRKAALDAWGSDKNLFARGAAELVTDEALTQAPLAAPGFVIKRSRGSVEEQMAALPRDKPKTAMSGGAATVPGRKPKVAEPPKPKPPPPSRAELDMAEAALEAFVDEARDQLTDIDRRARDLAKQRKQLVTAQSRERAGLESNRDHDAKDYQQAIERWRSV